MNIDATPSVTAVTTTIRKPGSTTCKRATMIPKPVALSTVYAVSASLDFGAISISGYLGGFGWVCNYDNGKLEFGLVAIYGYSISIDILWILEWLRQ